MIHYSNEHFLEAPDFPFFAAPYVIHSMHGIEPHSHEFIEFVYVAEGKGEHNYKGSSYSIAKGDVFVIEPGVEHAYQVSLNDELHVYNVLFQQG